MLGLERKAMIKNFHFDTVTFNGVIHQMRLKHSSSLDEFFSFHSNLASVTLFFVGNSMSGCRTPQKPFRKLNFLL